MDNSADGEVIQRHPSNQNQNSDGFQRAPPRRSVIITDIKYEDKNTKEKGSLGDNLKPQNSNQNKISQKVSNQEQIEVAQAFGYMKGDDPTQNYSSQQQSQGQGSREENYGSEFEVYDVDDLYYE